MGRSVLVASKAGTSSLPCDKGVTWFGSGFMLDILHPKLLPASCTVPKIFLNSEIWDEFRDVGGTRSVPEPMWDTWQPEPCLAPALPSGYHRQEKHQCLHYWYCWTFFAPPFLISPRKVLKYWLFDYSGIHLLSFFLLWKIHPKAENPFLMKFLWGLLHSVISFGFSKSGSVWMCGQNKIHLRASSL